MPRDTSLDEFAGGSEGSRKADAESRSDAEDPEARSDEGDPKTRADPPETAGDEVASTDQRPGTDEGGDPASDGRGPDAPEPATPTHAWTPGGTVCQRCGESADRRWRTDSDGMVCDDCKEW